LVARLASVAPASWNAGNTHGSLPAGMSNSAMALAFASPVTEAGGRSGLAIVAPADDATVEGRVVFTWRSKNADAYRIAVLTEKGDPVWTSDTGDTTAALPDSVSLEPGHAYFWRVDAIGTGIAASTGAHRLQIPRN